MASAHVVRVALVNVLADGSVKTTNEMTISQKIKANTEVRVRPDAAIPNSADYPKIEDYITAEAAAGFRLVHLDQSFIVTHKDT